MDSGRMKEAVRTVIDEGKSIRNICVTHDIKFSTLRRYVKKARTSENKDLIAYSPKYNCRQVFSHDEEILLQDYLIKASKIQYELTRKQVRELAYEFAVRNKKIIREAWTKNSLAGEDWFTEYMKHFPNLSLRHPEATSLSRATSFNKKNVKDCFDNLQIVLERHHFGPNDIYNSDETGCITVQKVGNTKVIACKSDKQVGKITSGERGTLVTMVGTINASGNSIPPFMVFPRVHFKDSMLHGAPPGTIGSAHQTGWMTTENFTVFMEHFIKSTKCSKELPVLLILDNHDTHLSIQTIDLAKDNGVIMLTLPPHCSHKMQPLDISVYGPFKSFYNQAANSFMTNHPGQTITIHDIAQIVGNAYPLAFKPNIIAGFRASGIYPFNPNVFSEEDFLGSYVTDRPEWVDAGEPMVPEHHHSAPVSPEHHCSAIYDTATHLKKPVAVASTSGAVASTTTNVENYIITPEQISPFPKAPPRKNKGGRKKGATLILTHSNQGTNKRSRTKEKKKER
ncbi:uncharacterized protein LOC121368514 [Gigantopelta aegis]|uniref:uncharacterized protein LOC121368514 n=1 Tax=Gigantopelta aegis TaxID=1735272 RepID=UPI001B88E6A8|nr:uncharacterized protein LOC121368514 [Gigantopelta aegis]